MKVFRFNEVDVACGDNATLSMKDVDNMTRLAKHMEDEIKDSICYVDFIFKEIVIRDKEGEKYNRLSFEEAIRTFW